MTGNQTGRTITEIRLRDDTQPSDFRVPLSATAEAIKQGCTCPPLIDINDPRLSPLRAPDLSGLPPAHIHTAGFDLLRDEGKAYADALERAGVRVHHVCHERMIHHFFAMGGAIPYARTALKTVGADIKAALSPVAALSGL
jgi:acetyl esterase/lipase